MHHSPFRRRWTGGTAAVNGMEERDRVDASSNLCSQPVAATGRRHLRPRPVDANRLFYFIDPWLLLAGDLSVLARLNLLFYFLTRPVAATGRRPLRPRPVDFVISSLLNMWLSLVGENSTIARLTLLYLTELLCDYFMLMYILWTNVCCCLVVGIVVERNWIKLNHPSKLR